MISFKQQAYLHALAQVYAQALEETLVSDKAYFGDLPPIIVAGPYSCWPSLSQTHDAGPTVLGILRDKGLVSRSFHRYSPFESPTPLWSLTLSGMELADILGFGELCTPAP
jgi:hypothetical protein